MVNIFDGTIELGILIADMISQFTGFDVSRGDSFSETICPPCLQDAQIAFQIKQRYERNQPIYLQFKEQILNEEEFIIPVFQITGSICGEEVPEFNCQIKREEMDDNIQEEEEFQDELPVMNEPIDDSVSEEEFCQIASIKKKKYRTHYGRATSILKSAENQIIDILQENEVLRVKLNKLSMEFKELADCNRRKTHNPTLKKKDAAKVMSFPIRSQEELDQFEKQFHPNLMDYYVNRVKVLLTNGPMSRNLQYVLDEDLLTKYNLNGSSGKLALDSYRCFFGVLEAATKIIHPNEPDAKKVIRKAIVNIKNKIVKRNSRSRKEMLEALKNNHDNV
nr:uncharacterized protein LOC108069181 [Drosophila takahashii]